MPSPFPGMNPYLEQDRVWHDFHQRFIPAAAEAIGPQVNPKYVVRIDEHVYVKEVSAEEQRLVGRSDVLVSQRPEAHAAATGTAILEAPAHVNLPAVDMERLSFIEVRDRDSWELITVVELLSPCNKYAGPDREQYLGKRAQLLNSPVHFVEIDLLRGGPRLPMQDLPECDYYVLVSRFDERPRAGIWPLQLHDPLPPIPIPLRAPDPPVSFDIQAVLHRVYDAAGYGIYIYLSEPQPRLSANDAAWARQYLPS